ncbi:hypothetical protein NIE79_000393 [Micromonospora sp. NIE79]|uniref:Uncharacterized protein n=1 Tax=Micromonospora trifolii TaxID=2911208 RepID=A0ABS9MY28_9ACTN|nr:hypothetical protein [Micromonospora trifolii]MCG5442612.1 hypothetical protein [Micromonospora trifolii]
MRLLADYRDDRSALLDHLAALRDEAAVQLGDEPAVNLGDRFVTWAQFR